VYIRLSGAGFFIVIESKPGSSRSSPAAPPFLGDVPDVQIEANRNLGDGSAAVCDIGPAPQQPLGGIPGIDPPSFDTSSSMIVDALNDFGCRLADNTVDHCTVNSGDNFAFVKSDSTIQVCTAGVVGSEIEFQQGDTLLTVQWRDRNGNVGFPQRLVIRVP